eukprot:3630340-Ditylum_brightwellii.AAC.1
MDDERVGLSWGWRQHYVEQWNKCQQQMESRKKMNFHLYFAYADRRTKQHAASIINGNTAITWDFKIIADKFLEYYRADI